MEKNRGIEDRECHSHDIFCPSDSSLYVLFFLPCTCFVHSLKFLNFYSMLEPLPYLASVVNCNTDSSENVSLEALPCSDWDVSIFMRHFLDSFLMRNGQTLSVWHYLYHWEGMSGLYKSAKSETESKRKCAWDKHPSFTVQDLNTYTELSQWFMTLNPKELISFCFQLHLVSQQQKTQEQIH